MAVLSIDLFLSGCGKHAAETGPPIPEVSVVQPISREVIEWDEYIGRLESPESVGKTAAARTVRRLGARKVPTARVPVVFEPTVARTLIENIFEAVNGDSIYRGASFLAGTSLAYFWPKACRLMRSFLASDS